MSYGLTVTSFLLLEDSKTTLSCEVGDTIQNGRITCTCTQLHVYECIIKKSSKNERDETTQKKFACQPNRMYVEESTTCICNRNGSWPNSACGDIFDSLPAENVVRTRCQPDGYVFVGCNVCRCDSNGYVDNTRCTNNECPSLNKRRSLKNSGKSVYGTCEAKNWYSLAPCQFCFCLNENKLVCNTGNFNTQKLHLGSYNLNVCGKDLIKEAIELLPDNKKSMRDGEGNIITTTSKPIPRNSLGVQSSNMQLQIRVSEEDKKSAEKYLNKNIETIQEKGGKETSSESANKEDSGVNNAEDNRVESTRSPYQEDDENAESTDEGSKEPTPPKIDDEESKDPTRSKKDDEEDKFTDHEVLEPGLKIPESHPTDIEENKPRVSLKNFEDFGAQLQASLPMVLENVFRMALRKSMVTVVNDNKCVPGSVHTVKCNTCFCMKNSKMVCTDNKCVKETNK